LQSKIASLKKEFAIVEALEDQSGFGVDEEGNVTAPDNVWEAYIAAHPAAAKYRGRKIDNWELLRECFSGTVATGNRALSNTGARLAAELEVRHEDEDDYGDGDDNNDEDDDEDQGNGAPIVGDVNGTPAGGARGARNGGAARVLPTVRPPRNAQTVAAIAELSKVITSFVNRPAVPRAARQSWIQDALDKLKLFCNTNDVEISNADKLKVRIHLSSSENVSILFCNMDTDDELHQYIQHILDID